MQRTTQQLPETCPNCAQPRAGIPEQGIAVYRCETQVSEKSGQLETKAGRNCRKVVMALRFKLVARGA